MPQEHRVTQSAIAKKAKVSQVTVSLALRDHPSIPESTRIRIKGIADNLGYHPDPMLSSLVAYRQLKKPASFQGVLAWVTNYPTENGWYGGQQVGYFMGAQQRANQLGYKLETFWLRQPKLNQNAAARILSSRSISGLLFAPQINPNTRLDFDMKQFSSITFGYSLVKPNLHVVMNHQFRNMSILVRHLREAGYSRVGLAMSSKLDERTNHNYLAGYLVEREAFNKRDQIPHLLTMDFSKNRFEKWFDCFRPEVIITSLSGSTEIHEWLVANNYKIPQDVGIALPNVRFEDVVYSGIDENPLLVGAMGVNTVVGMIHRNEKGISHNPQHILIEGLWVDGKTVLLPNPNAPQAQRHSTKYQL